MENDEISRTILSKSANPEIVEHDSKSTLNPLAAMQERLTTQLRASGFTVREMEPSPTLQLTATFIPKRK